MTTASNFSPIIRLTSLAASASPDMSLIVRSAITSLDSTANNINNLRE